MKNLNISEIFSQNLKQKYEQRYIVSNISWLVFIVIVSVALLIVAVMISPAILGGALISLVVLVCNKLKVNRSTYEILQILSISLLDKTPLNELLTNHNCKDVKELYGKQLKISWY